MLKAPCYCLAACGVCRGGGRLNESPKDLDQEAMNDRFMVEEFAED